MLVIVSLTNKWFPQREKDVMETVIELSLWSKSYTSRIMHMWGVPQQKSSSKSYPTGWLTILYLGEQNPLYYEKCVTG